MEKDKTLSELISESESKSSSTKRSKVMASTAGTKTNKQLLAATSYSTTGSNNLMNIRHSKNQTWLGEIGNKGGFIVFEKPEYSVRAFYKILNSYIKQGADTLEKIANKYAPRSDGNNPDTYVKLGKEILLANEIAMPKSGKVTYDMYPYLAKVFYKIESGKDQTVDYFKTIYKTYM